MHLLRIACVLCLTWLALPSIGRTEEFVSPDAIVPPEKMAQIKALIEKLNAPDNIQREEAEVELLKVGPAALPQLKEAVKSDKPEIAARAARLVGKLVQQGARPSDSYASVFPENAIFFIEAPNARKTLDKLKLSPLGKFWDLPAMQKFYQGHFAGQTPNDQKMLEAIREFPKLADGKAVFALGDPESSEAAELDPPLMYLLESTKNKELNTAARNMFQGLTDAPKANRRYGPFTIEEHTTAQSVFGETSLIHSLTAKGIETFLDTLIKRTPKPLTNALKDVTAMIPNYDFVYHISNKDFQRLSDDGQVVDDDQIETLMILGFPAGSMWQGVIDVTPDGFNERFKITVPTEVEGKKNEGFVGVLKAMAQAIPAAPKGDAPKSLDMIPWQAGVVVSFNGDTSKFAAALAKGIRDFDTHLAPLPRNNARPAPGMAPGAMPAPGQPAQPGQPGAAPAAPRAEGGKGLTPAQQALQQAGVNVTPGANPAAPAGGPAAGPAGQPPVAVKPAKPIKTPPHVTRFEKLGLKMEQFFEQVEGPATLGLFFQQIENDEAPDSVPVSPLFSVILKDPKAVEQALEAASAGAEPRFTREVLNGGMHYVENSGDPDTKPGFWLKDKHLAWSTERDLLELAGAALMHKAGNERYSDRANYKKSLAQNQPDPGALLTIYGDAEQCFEMPYKMAKINWQEDEDNPWPDYAHIKPLLASKELLIEFKAHKDGLEGTAKTPFSLFGLIESVRRTLNEAAFW